MKTEGSYPFHIAALPKSGSTWLKSLLTEVTGWPSYTPSDPEGKLKEHDLPTNLSDMPANREFVMKLHTRCTRENLRIIQKNDFKTLILQRNLRDQCVSNYFHVLADKSHRHHILYQELDKDTALIHRTTITLEEYSKWIRDWKLQLAKDSSKFHLISYEELKGNPASTLIEIIDFFGVSFPRDCISKAIENVAGRTEFNLKKNFRLNKGTARKGIVGDWRNHFKPIHTSIFETLGH